ncbi:hypothetical protein ABT033_31180 [Streptomyces pharetrae]|uniref:hypothetical protein n=1 Tax=Streptomyces pharetrae TaxID=291370 RepID=UPI00335EC652
MATRFFTFAAARITGHDAAGEPVPDSVLDLPVHGIAQAEPDPGAHGGERFTLLLALAEPPALPRTNEEWRHDVLLWDPSPVPPFIGHREVWLHRVALSPQDSGPDWVSLAGPAWGRSFHLERQPPVPFATGDCPLQVSNA